MLFSTFYTSTRRFAAIVLVLLVLGSLFALPGNAQAAGKAIGEICSTNGDCDSNDCESADDGKSYCDCNDDNDCSIYGSGTWDCVDGIDKSFDLDFCKKDTQIQYAIPPKADGTTGGTSAYEAITNPDGAVTQSEIADVISAPQLRIKIPGVTFSSEEDIKKNTRDLVGVDGQIGTYQFIPFIGEYLATVYRYAVIVAGLIAVIVLIIQGFVITASAGNSERISHAKERIFQAISGLLIAVASYLILFTINPELVQFKSLRILSVAPKELPDRYEDDFLPGEAATLVYNKQVNKGVIPCDYPEENGLVPIPGGLPGVKYIGPKGMGYLLPQVIEPLKKAGANAAAEGYTIAISTACRPMATQKKFAQSKESVAAGTTAKAGKSPHGFGYAVDIHLLKGKKDLSCNNKDGCIFDKASQGPSGNQCALVTSHAEFAEAREKASQFFATAGWVRLTKESWHFEYGTANVFCRAQCSGPATICGVETNCPKNINGCNT